LAALGELAMNLRWSWHEPTRELLAAADPAVWDRVGHDPFRLLGEISAERLDQLAADPDFRARLDAAAADLSTYLTAPRWYQLLAAAGNDLGPDQAGDSRETGRPKPDPAATVPPDSIAYFSPEFGITAAMPQYSGGLGILAGDHLKAASDLGVPIIGVGLLYRRGYFTQTLSPDGWQIEHYPLIDPYGLPLALLRDEAGAPLRVRVGLPGGRVLAAQVWRAQVGRVPLLLLDSDIEDNGPGEREVTDKLYGGGTEHRLLQEMLLGIGGVRAIRAYCRITGTPEPVVFHTNEGHAGFLGLERIRELAEENGLSFDTALEVARTGTVFTTHTPVPAGIDRFPRELIMQYFGGDNTSPGTPVERILELGAETYEGGSPDLFNMAVMGLRLAQRANGVSLLHGRVSREMFAGLWPGFDSDEVPIGSVTNGVHAPTWVRPEVTATLAEYAPPGAAGIARHPEARSSDHPVSADGPARNAPPTAPGGGWELVADTALWRLRGSLRAALVEDVRRRLRESWRRRGASEAELGWVSSVLDPEVLTIGFARRVPSYKRLTLMLRDPDRLKRLLLHPTQPIQVVVAGKAHPADDSGKALVRDLVRFADDPAVRHRIVFLPNYDMGMAQTLLPGCDVWLNNPLRPLEACGTSGMKAALNGCLNLSILDGWWDELYDGQNGWAIPSASGVEDQARRDDLEAAALYDLVENRVAPQFYDRDSSGLPTRWLEMVRHTLRSLGPRVGADRMLRDYVHELYAPAARSVAAVSSDDFAGAKVLADWKARVRHSWAGVRVDHVESDGVADATLVGATLLVRAFVSLGDLTPEDVAVQVAYGRVDDADRITEPLFEMLAPAEAYEAGRWRYEGSVALAKPGQVGFTVRVLPKHGLLVDAAEMGLIALP
jgi:starch phosphorylase